MKKTITLLALCFSACTFLKAQTFPYGINYQAVARDANGNAKTNTSVPLRFTINRTTSSGTIVWQETQSSNSNSMGQFTAMIGSGVRQPASALVNFSDIDWVADKYFLTVEIQTGLSTFVTIGTQQFMSVPYAMATPNDVPVGSVMAYFGTTPPPGWLLCDGSAVGRSAYPKLFNILGLASGQGDGSSTFNLPDLRGMFLRGVDGAAGNDPDKATRTAQNTGGNTGNNVGSKESDAFQGHAHIPSSGLSEFYCFPPVSGGTGLGGGTSSGQPSSTTGGVTTDGVNGISRSGTETRPKNVYVNYIIKY